MKYELTEEDKRLLRSIRRHLHGSSEFGFAPAVYITPAQQLRNAADDIERKDKEVAAFDELLSKL